jgi:catechol 2,3-dioxygenase-like lactoylglutathione lyase family enzyme
VATLYHQLSIQTSRERLYEAIATEGGIADWWDAPKALSADDGLVLEFRPGPEHGVLRMKVLERVPGTRVGWECISRHPASSPASAWTGTRITFEIGAAENGVMLDFRHTGWDESSKYLGFCNHQWGVALQKLKQRCESRPVATRAMVVGIDHVQLAMPSGREDEARRFYTGLLGIPERRKPAALAKRGGVWFENDAVKIHLGVEADFHAARKAHPALLVRDLRALVRRLREAGVEVIEDALEGYDRAYLSDPFENRLELMEPRGDA